MSRADEVAEALETLDAARKRFVAVVGHELRTPVTTIRGLAEELEQALADLPPEHASREIVPALVRCARRAETLLDDLLLATDIVTALPVAAPEPIDLVAAAQAAWDALDVGVDLVLLGDVEAVALLRPPAGDWMLGRVLDNARRYGEPPFGLHAETAGGTVRLTVSSGGPRLAEDDLALAFEVFYRGEAAVTSAPGFGLGLPVARALARQHGGEVVLAARANGGLDVTIEVPAAS
jgi:signal transduction histidine kinase